MPSPISNFVILANSSLTQKISDWAVSVMSSLGSPGAALLIALENLFPPLPSEAILPLAGFTASQGDLSLVGVIIWTTIGSVVGALILYWLGALLGRDRLRNIAKKLPLMKVSDIDKTEKWFEKHEDMAVFWGRMIPIFRSLISIPAGVERMPLIRFTIFTAAGSLVWNTVLILAGYFLGEKWNVVQDYVGIFQVIVIIVVVLAVLGFIFTRVSKKRKSKQAS